MSETFPKPDPIKLPSKETSITSTNTSTTVSEKSATTKTGLSKRTKIIIGVVIVVILLFLILLAVLASSGNKPQQQNQEEQTVDKFDTTKWENKEFSFSNIFNDNDFTLTFKTKTPSGTQVNEYKTSGNYGKELVHSDFKARFYIVMEGFTTKFTDSNPKTFVTTEFGTVYRIKEKNVYYYVTEYSNTKSCESIDGPLTPPCGSNFITEPAPSKVGFTMECDATDENVKFCDQILENLSVSRKEESTPVANESEPEIPEGWSVKTSSKCSVEMPLPPQTGKYVEIDGTSKFFWEYQEQSTGAQKQYDLFDTVITEHYWPHFVDSGEIIGSGDISGSIGIFCGPKLKDLATAENTLKAAVTKLNADLGSDSGITPFSYIKVDDSSILGIPTIEYQIRGGMENPLTNSHLFIYKDHVYSVTKIDRPNKAFANETLDLIYLNMRFK